MTAMLGGVLTAIVTPFDDEGRIDFDSFQALARHLVDNGSDGLVVAGTTGECATLDDRERLDLLRAAVEAVGERATVVAGTGTASTAHSVELTEQAHEAGADAFLVVTPYYIKPPQRGIVAHFEAIARGDRPADRRLQHPEPRGREHRAGDDLAPRRDPEITAVKQAQPDPDAGAPHRRPAASTCTPATTTSSSRSSSSAAVGGICVHTHVVGPQVAEQVAAARAGDLERAAQIDRELAPGLRAARDHDEPDPDQGGAEPARPRGRRLPAAARRRRAETSWRRSAPASRGSGCSSPPRPAGPQTMQAIVFCGIQGAGKSSFYRDRFARHARPHQPRHAEDESAGAGPARGVPRRPAAVRGRQHEPDRRRAGGATSPRRPRPGSSCVGYYFRAGVGEAIARNGERGRQLRPGAIVATAKRLEPPRLEEGFDALFAVTVGGNGRFELHAWSGGERRRRGGSRARPAAKRDAAPAAPPTGSERARRLRRPSSTRPAHAAAGGEPGR